MTLDKFGGGEIPISNVWCFGFPCQDVSNAGKRAGIKKGTRSGLFFEVIRLLEERIRNHQKVPELLLIENVKNLLSIDGGRGFATVLLALDKIGYDVEWCVLDSSEVVPQHRERTYIVGHLRGKRTREVFPITGKSKAIDTNIKVIGNVSKTGHHSDDVVADDGLSKTITAQNAYKHTPKVAIKQVGQLQKNGSFNGNPQVGRVYGTDGLSPTLNTMQGGDRQPKIMIKNNTKKGYLEARNGDGVDLAYPTSNSRRGRVQKQRTNTLETGSNLGVAVNNGRLRIRKLTPLECWRLQGFTDEQFIGAKNSGISNSQLYKQAGNAVTVPVVKAIAERLCVE